MAATKSTKTAKSAKKTTGKSKTTGSKTAGAKKTKKTTKSKAVKSTKTTAKKTAKTTKRKTTSSASKKNKSAVSVFLVGAVKQASKVQKKAQAETKVWIKKLNAQDKQLSQLTKKLSKAKPRSKRGLDTKINKLQAQMTETRTGLLAAENAGDKIATFIEWATQLNSKPATTAYLQSSSSSRPTLISSSKSRSKPQNTPSIPTSEEDEYSEERDDEMNFLFGEDEDEEANR